MKSPSLFGLAVVELTPAQVPAELERRTHERCMQLGKSMELFMPGDTNRLSKKRCVVVIGDRDAHKGGDLSSQLAG